MLSFSIDEGSDLPVYIRIYEHIKNDIEKGIIKSSEKLPSKRALAADLGVSVITVENAYGQLLAEGYIRSVPKKGYFAENISGLFCSEQSAEDIDQTESGIEQTSAETLFPFSVWAKIMREELSENSAALMKKPPNQGVPELRTAIAEYLKKARGINASPEQIIIGAGTEYLCILIRLILGDDKIIATEDPGYRTTAKIYESLGLKCVHIPMMNDGIDIDALEASSADAVHISPSHQFPTGVVTSVSKRYSLLSWASRGKYIIEDDYDSEFRLSGRPIPSMFSIDVTDRVIYMNTFSKSLSPTIRISYMVLPQPLLKQFRSRSEAFSCPVPTFEQYTLARFISQGHFERHIRRLRRRCKEGRDRLSEYAASHELFKNCRISGASAGMHCIVKFDTELDDETLAKRAEALGFNVAVLKELYSTAQSDMHSLIIYY